MALERWQYRRNSKDVIFVYKLGEMNPAFKLTSTTGNWPFSGHGLTFRSRRSLFDFLNSEGEVVLKRLRRESK